MSLDPRKLNNLVTHADGSQTAQCPACQAAGHDKTGNHLHIFPDGHFGCVQFPGDSGHDHRQQIFALAGDQPKRNGTPPRKAPAAKAPAAKDGKLSKLHANYESAIRGALFGLKQSTGDDYKPVKKWLYQNRDGTECAYVIRFEPPEGAEFKTFKPMRAEPSGWRLCDPDTAWPLYHLPEVLKSTGTIFVTEGEKACDAARSIGLPATTSSHGAKSPHLTDWTTLAGRHVVILPDCDPDGETYASKVAAIVTRLNPPATVNIVRLPGLPPKGDFVEFLESRDAATPEAIKAEVQNLADAAPVWAPKIIVHEDTAALREPTSMDPDFPLTDYGNAERLVRDHGDKLKHCGPFGKWFVWDGKRWCEDETGEVIRCAKDSVRRIHTEADRIRPGESKDEYERKALGDIREKIFKHAIKSEENNEIKAMIEMAQTEKGIPVLPPDLDKDPFALCVLNGVIDLRTGTLKPHNRGDLITKLAPVHYDPAATCPRWDAFLMEVFGGDVEVVAYIQRAVGYSVTADVREQVLFFFYGTGANGKTTFMTTVSGMVGDYSQRAPRSLILADGKSGEKIPADVARLKGARLVSCSELDEGRALAEATVKDLTGADRIVARFMRENFFEFDPTHKLWMLGNHRPAIRGTDHGIWRRIQLIPFMVTFGDDRKDPDLQTKLNSELPGILAWAVRGCLEWQRIGLKPPSIVNAAVKEYRESEDLVGLFIEDKCDLSPKHWSASNTLYSAFRGWCEASGDRPLGNKSFTNRLRDRGFLPDKVGDNRGWKGVSLKDLP